MASNLQGFLSKFNSSEGLWVNQVDTLHTFDITFKFWPNKLPKAEETKEKKKGFFEKAFDSVVDSAIGAAKGAVKNGLNNLTGGLFGAAMNDGNVYDEKKYDSRMTFIDYLARGNMLQTGADETWFGGTQDASNPQLVLDMSYYVQNIQMPQIQMDDEGTVKNHVGEFPVNGKIVKPTTNQVTLEILNTKAPLAERIFYPWLREVTLPFWSYDDQPYSTADVEIDFSKHSDNKYVLVGCRPTQIETLKPSNELGSPMRSVTLIFDYMFVLSKLDRTDGVMDKLWDTGKSLLGDAGGMLGL